MLKKVLLLLALGGLLLSKGDQPLLAMLEPDELAVTQGLQAFFPLIASHDEVVKGKQTIWQKTAPIRSLAGTQLSGSTVSYLELPRWRQLQRGEEYSIALTLHPEVLKYRQPGNITRAILWDGNPQDPSKPRMSLWKAGEDIFHFSGGRPGHSTRVNFAWVEAPRLDLVLVTNKPSQKYQVYVNGELVQEIYFPTDKIPRADHLFLGKGFQPPIALAGGYSRFGLWDRALTPQEVQTLHEESASWYSRSRWLLRGYHLLIWGGFLGFAFGWLRRDVAAYWASLKTALSSAE